MSAKAVAIAYTRQNENGKTETGVAPVVPSAGRRSPSWADCARAIPGFVTGGRLVPRS